MRIQKVPCPGNHAITPRRVVRATAFRPAVLGDGIGTIEGVIQAAPAGVGGIECVARVHHRHHQLWAGDAGDLRVHVICGDAKGGRLGVQITDLPQKCLIGTCVKCIALVGAMPVVNLCLQGLALREQTFVLRSQRSPHVGHALPEMIGVDAGSRCDLLHQQ